MTYQTPRLRAITGLSVQYTNSIWHRFWAFLSGLVLSIKMIF